MSTEYTSNQADCLLLSYSTGPTTELYNSKIFCIQQSCALFIEESNKQEKCLSEFGVDKWEKKTEVKRKETVCNIWKQQQKNLTKSTKCLNRR